MRPLARLRLGLTAWYAGTLGLMLVLLGVGLFVVIRKQMSNHLDHSLEGAARELMRAAAISEVEATSANDDVIDAVDELRIPDRGLFLLDSAGRPVKPAFVDSTILHAVSSISSIPVWSDVELFGSGLRVYAQRFTTVGGKPYIAVAAADHSELRDEYSALIAAFAGAAFVAVLLVAGGGYLLIRKSTAPVEQAMEYMRRFMADAAHELRTPLTVVRTRAEVTLQRDRANEEYVSALKAIEREAQRLGGIVEDLLLLARADAGERPLQRSAVLLDELVLEVAGGAGVVAERRGVTLEVERADETAVQGDPTLLRQLVSIVLDNAVKFTPSGGQVRVEVEAKEGIPRFTVEDTGAGISVEQLPHIFERFYRADPARARSDGAGLGLAIARWIADAHGAIIDVKSEVGKGTRVAVRFPAAVSSS